MLTYYTKSALYNKVHRLRNGFHISRDSYPIDAVKLCNRFSGLQVSFWNFKTPGLKGMSYIAERPESDVIILNAGLTKKEQNFICTHELMHLALHRNEATNSFDFNEKNILNQDSSLEWQANEGAAEFLLPAAILLPIIGTRLSSLRSWYDIEAFKVELSEQFNVTKTVIEIRFEHLKYEIYQYLQGIPLKDIEVISFSKQKAKGINVLSLNDIENKLMIKEKTAPLYHE